MLLTRTLTHCKHSFSTVVHKLRASSTRFAVASFGLLGACTGEGGAGGADTSRAGNGAATASAFRVALLTPGPISDQSWNGGAYEGLLRIRDSLGASISHIQTRTPSEFDEQFRQY